MQPLNLHINWIQNRNKNRSVRFLYATYIVLFLFFLQLLIAPLTFSNELHCPMMGNTTSTSMSMGMDDCIHMQHAQNDKQDHSHKSQHGMVFCPLCANLALANPLLVNDLELPAIRIVASIIQVKAYSSQAPPPILTRNHPPRAPPYIRS